MASYQDDVLVKKAFSKTPYTKDQIDELRACMDPETGPYYFISNFMYVQHPTKGKEKLVLYDYQIELLHNYHGYRKSVNLLGRQLGKTTVASGYLLWYAMFVDDSTILIASNKYDSAQEIMLRIRYAYESMPNHIRAGVKTYNKRSIDFDNGSRIVSTTTTETTGRGMSLSLVYMDELGFVDPGISKAMWTSLSPTLSTGGKCIITSTPNTDEDQFAEIWFGALRTINGAGEEQDVGLNGFKAYMATWERHPDRDEVWAATERASIGDERFEREHNCDFITFEETLISPAKLNRLDPITPIKVTGQVRWYAEINPMLTYIVALDPSMGTGGDNAAIQVLSLPNLTQVAEWCNNRTPVEGQIRTMRGILEDIYNDGRPEIYWSVENNGLGEAALVVIRDTGEENFPGTMLHDPTNRASTGRGKRRAGFVTTNKSKIETCAKLKSLVESDRMKLNSKALVSELKVFVSRANTFEARSGQTDDLVMALVLAIRMVGFVSTWDDSSREAFSSNIVTEDDNTYAEPMPMIF